MLQGSLSRSLSRYPPWAQPVSAVRAAGERGGLSGAAIWRYAAALGELAVRAWPVGRSIAWLM